MNPFIRKIILVLLGTAITGMFASGVAGLVQIPFLKLLEYATYDARVRLTGDDLQDPRVVIVDIDEKSLAAEGRWPWRRDKVGRLVDQLVGTYGAEVVAFDMVFAERDENFSLDQLRELASENGDLDLIERIEIYEPRLDRDALFADSIAASGRVVLGYFFHHSPNETSTVGSLPEPLFPAESGLQYSTLAIQATGFAGNLVQLQQSALGAGFFSNPVVDDDGVYRRVPVVAEYEGGLYASLALAAVQSYIGIDAEPLLAPGSENLSDYPALEALELAGVAIPVDANATALVPYKGPEGAFPYVSATDVLNGTVADSEMLAGTIALIGTTAAGLVDLRPTPVQNVYPGVEVHANLIAGILDGTIRRQPAYTVAVEILLVLICGTLLSLTLPFTSPLLGGVVTFGMLGVTAGINVYAWDHLLHVIPFAASMTTILLVYVLNVVFGFFFEARSRNQLGRLFGQYVPPELVDEMSRDPAHYSLVGAKRELTVLFSDVRNFTSISEAMDPAELTRMMDSFLTPLTGAVHRNKGTIDKYMGDALMAFWGAPVDDEAHASNAVKAALEMQTRIVELGPSFEAQGWQRLKIGIGINTGEMSVGNMGSEFRVAYTVMGDAVNLASRLEGLTKSYGVPIVVSEFTAAHAPQYTYVELDLVRVKGKQNAVAILMPLGLAESLDEAARTFVSSHHEALGHFRARRFEQARAWFEQQPTIASLTTLYANYVARIDQCLVTPPDQDWDGVFVLENK